jgi:hypothetical protein
MHPTLPLWYLMERVPESEGFNVGHYRMNRKSLPCVLAPIPGQPRDRSRHCELVLGQSALLEEVLVGIRAPTRLASVALWCSRGWVARKRSSEKLPSKAFPTSVQLVTERPLGITGALREPGLVELVLHFPAMLM